MRVLFLAFMLAFAAPLAAAQPASTSPPAEWKLFRFPQAHVMFRAPPTAQPALQEQTGTTAGVPVPEHRIVVVDGGSWAWMIDVGDETGNNLTLNIDNVPVGAMNAIGAHFVGPVRTVAYPGGEAREYDAASDKFVIRSRVIVVGRFVYQILALTTASVLPPNSEDFLTSLTPTP